MLKYYKFSTKTRQGVVCMSDRVPMQNAMEFTENFNSEWLTDFTAENDNNNGSEFHAVCQRKRERIEGGLCMVTYHQPDKGLTVTTGSQLSLHTDYRLTAKPQPKPTHRKRKGESYERSYGKINPLAYVDWFGKKKENNVW